MTLEGFPSREAIAAHQLRQLRKLLAALVPGNRFYAPRICQAGLGGELRGLDDFFLNMPFTRKEEIAADQQAHPPYGTNLSFPLPPTLASRRLVPPAVFPCAGSTRQ